MFYRATINANGGNVVTVDGKKKLIRSLKRARPVELPARVLIGYASNCDAARIAVHQGTNVVVWAFVDIASAQSDDRYRRRTQAHETLTPTTNLNLTAVEDLINELDLNGYDVVHLISVGGWNGPHLSPHVSAFEWYSSFKTHLGDLFHGIDWDLEGNDDLNSPLNLFTIECLEKIGDISRLVHQGRWRVRFWYYLRKGDRRLPLVVSTDGYVVSMAPPQSYLDINGSKRFSRQVNWTDEGRGWHDNFSYFGRNVYAFVLKRYGNWIDLVSIQLYESYSRADYAVLVDGQQPSDFLINFVQQLASSENFLVDFSEDVETRMQEENVTLPLSKLVFGFANGWALDTDNKALFIEPDEVSVAWDFLLREQLLPRGFMFWSIDVEGLNGIYLARELSLILDL
jgi:hypothetical protein